MSWIFSYCNKSDTNVFELVPMRFARAKVIEVREIMSGVKRT